MADASLASAQLQQLRLQQTAKSGAGWFKWVAGLSAFNSLALWLGFEFSFLGGLGVTQIADAYGLVLGSNAVIPVMFINLVAIGLFITVGRLALRYPAVYVVGMAAYLLDAVPLLLFGDYLGGAFHLFALVFMVRGFRAAAALRAAGSPVVLPEPARVVVSEPVQSAAVQGTEAQRGALPASLKPLFEQIERHYDDWRACCEDPFGDEGATSAQQDMEETMAVFLEGATEAGADQDWVISTLKRRFPHAPGLEALRVTG